jgi:hypothetical protein
MEFQDRFFGRGTPQLGGLPVANPRLADPPAFHLLFRAPLDLDADALTLALREYHPDLEKATAELQKLQPGGSNAPAVMGLIGWGRHVLKLVGYDSPLESNGVVECVQASHYEVEIKEDAYQHTAHIVLHYAGYEQDALEQHVALAAAAGVLARFGAIVTLNQAGHTSIPSVALLPHEEDEGDTLRALRGMPIPYIYAGFVKIEIDGEPGVWMRTYGCQVFGLPDLAFHAEGHHQGTLTFNLFSNMLAYLRGSDRTFAPGDTMGVGDGQFFRFRARSTEEWFLESVGEMLVVEPISADEVNT